MRLWGGLIFRNQLSCTNMFLPGTLHWLGLPLSCFLLRNVHFIISYQLTSWLQRIHTWFVLHSLYLLLSPRSHRGTRTRTHITHKIHSLAHSHHVTHCILANSWWHHAGCTRIECMHDMPVGITVTVTVTGNWFNATHTHTHTHTPKKHEIYSRAYSHVTNCIIWLN